MRARGLKHGCVTICKLCSLVAPRAGAWIETDRAVEACYHANVAPRAGAWIETIYKTVKDKQDMKSRPVRARGLKLSQTKGGTRKVQVAPRAGAWIETQRLRGDTEQLGVAPRAGAWIETNSLIMAPLKSRVAPRAGAWIETVKTP